MTKSTDYHTGNVTKNINNHNNVVTNLFKSVVKGKVKIKVLLLYSATRPDSFSSALQPNPLTGDSPNLGVSHHLQVIRADGQLTSHVGLAPSICPPYVFASPNFTPW